MENIVPMVVCVNYSDYLEETLRCNRLFFKDYYVLTKDTDKDTKNVCDFYDVNCIIFDENTYNAHSCSFNKSGMVHQLQKLCHEKYPDAWMLLLDGDICLPEDFVQLFTNKVNQLDRNALYGMKRKDCNTYDDYINFNEQNYGGDHNAGYFQMYFRKDIYYDTFSDNCSNCDMVFQHRFSPRYLLCDNSYVVHLGQNTVNHSGRHSAQWHELSPVYKLLEREKELIKEEQRLKALLGL